jgi:hypothetical protein
MQTELSCISVEKHLPSMCEALDLFPPEQTIPSTHTHADTQNSKRKKKKTMYSSKVHNI